MRALWKLAQHLSVKRGKNDVNRIDYNFSVDWSAGPDGRVTRLTRHSNTHLRVN